MLVLLCAVLVGCGGGGGGGDATVSVDGSDGAMPARNVSVSSVKPIDAYVIMGRQIKGCWFNASAPMLPKYVYRADVSPDSSKVKITVHEAQPLGRAGMTAYTIDFKQEGPSTILTTQNVKMSPEMAAKMQYDIDRWKRGDTTCNKTMPEVAAAPATTGSAPAKTATAKPAAPKPQ